MAMELMALLAKKCVYGMRYLQVEKQRSRQSVCSEGVHESVRMIGGAARRHQPR